MSPADPARLREDALRAEQSGDVGEARRLIALAVAAAPRRADLHNTAGAMALRSGDVGGAIAAFGQASAAAPGELEYALNLAIALGRADRAGEAVTVLRTVEAPGSAVARYCSARAALERQRGALAEAQAWYQACLRLDPAHARALQGRARVALERGDPAAPVLYDEALAVSPADAELWLGKAQALEAAGRGGEARAIGAELVSQVPHWLDALRLMAQLRLGDGEADFARDYREAAERLPADPSILAAWCAVLSGLGHEAEAARVAALGRERFGESSPFPLLHAVHAGAAGDDETADAIFATLKDDGLERALHEARHRLRRREPDEAERLLGGVIAAQPDNIAAWALRDVGWRMAGDARHEWLHGREGLVASLPLDLSAEHRNAATALLDRLHDASTLPLGQSVRGGSQTRGGLFDRMEPELAALRQGIERTLAAYRQALPPAEQDHPMLRHRDAAWRIAGSWSVRLSAGGGSHVSHIHPQGIVSSALYLALPAETADSSGKAGWLEIGRPAADLRTDLPPLHEIEPKEGFLALFPSTLYHGTRPFSEGRRMTVAFDVSTQLA